MTISSTPLPHEAEGLRIHGQYRHWRHRVRLPYPMREGRAPGTVDEHPLEWILTPPCSALVGAVTFALIYLTPGRCSALIRSCRTPTQDHSDPPGTIR